MNTLFNAINRPKTGTKTALEGIPPNLYICPGQNLLLENPIRIG